MEYYCEFVVQSRRFDLRVDAAGVSLDFVDDDEDLPRLAVDGDSPELGPPRVPQRFGREFAAFEFGVEHQLRVVSDAFELFVELFESFLAFGSVSLGQLLDGLAVFVAEELEVIVDASLGGLIVDAIAVIVSKNRLQVLEIVVVEIILIVQFIGRN